jgi:hypothetical protein
MNNWPWKLWKVIKLGIFRSVYIFVCKKKSTMPAAYGICLIWNIKKKSNVFLPVQIEFWQVKEVLIQRTDSYKVEITLFSYGHVQIKSL